jgi:hypothetical protein
MKSILTISLIFFTITEVCFAERKGRDEELAIVAVEVSKAQAFLKKTTVFLPKDTMLVNQLLTSHIYYLKFTVSVMK